MKRKRSRGSTSPEIVPKDRLNPMEFHSPLPGPNRKRRVSIQRSSSVGQSESPTIASPSCSRIGSGASSAYEENAFDSNSVHSGSQASVGSGASGRRGPLSDWARAGMNTVKRVGAC